MKISELNTTVQQKGGEECNPGTVGNADKNRFTSAMNRKRNDQRDGKKKEDSDIKGGETKKKSTFGKTDDREQSAEVRTAGDTILQSMENRRGNDAVAAPEKSDGLASAIDEIVDRILVARSEMTGGKDEVRISLKSAVLPDTEVHVSRVDGTLNINFMTGSESSRNTINQNIDAFRTRLQDVVKTDVVVQTKFQDQNASGDGRSRQQRDLYEEMQDQ